MPALLSNEDPLRVCALVFAAAQAERQTKEMELQVIQASGGVAYEGV